MGAAVDTVTIAFPVKPTSCLSSILHGPLEGWVKQVLPAVATTDSSFLPLAVTVSPGFHGTKKTSERGDHNGLRTHLTKPSLINTHTLRTAGSTYKWRGAYGGWPVWHVHNDNTGCR